MWHAGRAAAMATLVAVDGSSYRKPGARLMVATDGEYVGSISGGCLEAELARKARWLVRGGVSVQRYSTAFDDTRDIPYGLGCGGTVQVLLEPANTPEFESLMDALANSLNGEASNVYTALPEDGRPFLRVIRAEAGEAEAQFTGSNIHHEWLEPPPRLLIFGAGNDSQPLVSMAASIGWRVVVCDGRAQWARPERFPEAERVVVANPDVPLAVPVQKNDFAVVMTHSFEQDREWLRVLLPQGMQYLGLLGARHRSARLAGEVAALLAWPIEKVCEHLRAPVGLDLGGDGAETIALSIIAEMQACAARRPLLSRRMAPAEVAEQMTRAESSDRFQAQCTM